MLLVNEDEIRRGELSEAQSWRVVGGLGHGHRHACRYFQDSLKPDSHEVSTSYKALEVRLALPVDVRIGSGRADWT